MFLAGMSLLSATAMAQDAKIGIINLEQALFTSDAARGVQGEIEAEFSSDVERAQSLQEELVALQGGDPEVADLSVRALRAPDSLHAMPQNLS